MRIVLVHGAWHGPWAWESVQAGVSAIAGPVEAVDVSINAVGAHGTLDDQAHHLVAAIKDGPGSAVVVAHSHAGLVVQQAYPQVADLVDGVIGVDAWFAEPGRTFLDTVPEWMRDALVGARTSQDGGWVVPAPDPTLFGVNDDVLAAGLRELLSAQPFGTLDAPSVGINFGGVGVRSAAIACEPRVLPFADLASGQGMPVTGIESGHDVMLLEPDGFVSVFERALHTVLNDTSAVSTTSSDRS